MTCVCVLHLSRRSSSLVAVWEYWYGIDDDINILHPKHVVARRAASDVVRGRGIGNKIYSQRRQKLVGISVWCASATTVPASDRHAETNAFNSVRPLGASCPLPKSRQTRVWNSPSRISPLIHTRERFLPHPPTAHGHPLPSHCLRWWVPGGREAEMLSSTRTPGHCSGTSLALRVSCRHPSFPLPLRPVSLFSLCLSLHLLCLSIGTR
jgi:hypothetical protein